MKWPTYTYWSRLTPSTHPKCRICNPANGNKAICFDCWERLITFLKVIRKSVKKGMLP